MVTAYTSERRLKRSFKEENVGVPERDDGDEGEVVDSNANTRSIQQEERARRPANRLVRGLACLALEAAVDSRLRAYLHAEPPLKPLQYLKSASDAGIVGSVRVVGVLYPPSVHEGHVYLHRLVPEQESGADGGLAGVGEDGFANQGIRFSRRRCVGYL